MIPFKQSFISDFTSSKGIGSRPLNKFSIIPQSGSFVPIDVPKSGSISKPNTYNLGGGTFVSRKKDPLVQLIPESQVVSKIPKPKKSQKIPNNSKIPKLPKVPKGPKPIVNIPKQKVRQSLKSTFAPTQDEIDRYKVTTGPQVNPLQTWAAHSGLSSIPDRTLILESRIGENPKWAAHVCIQIHILFPYS